MEFNATFIVSAISFIIFTLIMNKILYKPITNIVEQRQAYLDANAIAERENLDNAQRIQDDKNAKIFSSKAEAKSKIMTEVEILKIDRINQEKAKKEEIAQAIAKKKSEIEQEKEMLSNEMESNVEDISASIMSKLNGGDV